MGEYVIFWGRGECGIWGEGDGRREGKGLGEG